MFILDKCVLWKVKTSGDVMFVMPEKSEPSKEDGRDRRHLNDLMCQFRHLCSPQKPLCKNTTGKVTVVNPLVSMTTGFCTGSQSGIYELFITQPVCKLVFMHYILRSHILTVAHARSHLSLCLRTAVEVWIFPDLSRHDV